MSTGVLTLSGTSSVANYQTALRSVTYTNTSGTPVTPRTVTFSVTDNTTPSNTIAHEINIGSTVNRAPTASPTFGDPDADGRVIGDLHGFDPDGDGLTYNVTSQGGHGIAVVHPDGTFTYTPTTAARFAALADPDDATDFFTVAVSDGVNPAVSVTVDHVSISPVQMNIGPRFGLNDGQPTYPATVVAGPDGRGYVYDLASQSVHVISPDGQHMAIPVGTVFGQQGIAVSPDGTTLYVTTGNPATQTAAVGVFNTNTGAKITDIPLSRVATDDRRRRRRPGVCLWRGRAVRWNAGRLTTPRSPASLATSSSATWQLSGQTSSSP